MSTVNLNAVDYARRAERRAGDWQGRAEALHGTAMLLVRLGYPEMSQAYQRTSQECSRLASAEKHEAERWMDCAMGLTRKAETLELQEATE